ncbi:MAG: nuclear transport factor 2 family protein [Parvibaculaceae bacterium]
MTSYRTHGIVRAWLDAVSRRDGPALIRLLSDDVVLLPPFQDEEVRGARNVLETFSAVEAATQAFAYRRSWVAEDSAVLEFSATVDGCPIHGIDLIHFDTDGKIDRFDILTRSVVITQSLGGAVKKYLSKNARR